MPKAQCQDRLCDCGSAFRSSKKTCSTDKDCERSCSLNWKLILGVSGAGVLGLGLIVWGLHAQLKANKEADELSRLIRKSL